MIERFDGNDCGGSSGPAPYRTHVGPQAQGIPVKHMQIRQLLMWGGVGWGGWGVSTEGEPLHCVEICGKWRKCRTL